MEDESEIKLSLLNLIENSKGGLGIAYALDHHWMKPIHKQVLETIYPHISNVLSKDLLSRFYGNEVPLNADLDVEKIMALSPNLEIGKHLFFNDPTLQCASCHRFKGVGGLFGPDLSKISEKYSPAQLLQHIQNPSLLVDEAYQVVSIETGTGEIWTGIITNITESKISLRDARGGEIQILKEEIKDQYYSDISAMPEGLLEGKEKIYIRHLLGFLSS